MGFSVIVFPFQHFPVGPRRSSLSSQGVAGQRSELRTGLVGWRQKCSRSDFQSLQKNEQIQLLPTRLCSNTLRSLPLTSCVSLVYVDVVFFSSCVPWDRPSGRLEEPHPPRTRTPRPRPPAPQQQPNLWQESGPCADRTAAAETAGYKFISTFTSRNLRLPSDSPVKGIQVCSHSIQIQFLTHGSGVSKPIILSTSQQEEQLLFSWDAL